MSKGGTRAGDVTKVHETMSSDPYAMSAQERSKYESIFPVYDSDRDGFLTGPETVELFSKSGLPREVRKTSELCCLMLCSTSSSRFVFIRHIFI